MSLVFSVLSLQKWDEVEPSMFIVFNIYMTADNSHFLAGKLVPTSHCEKDSSGIIFSDLSSSVNGRDMVILSSVALSLLRRGLCRQFPMASFT